MQKQYEMVSNTDVLFELFMIEVCVSDNEINQIKLAMRRTSDNKAAM